MDIERKELGFSLKKYEPNLEGIRWNSAGLIPAVVQDVDSGEVLMLAYMNEEALRLTLTEGRAWYYSRSRQQLWRKGETSGHTQAVQDIRFDCDQDAVLLLVEQTGMACHENYFSCFHYHDAEAGFTRFGQAEQKPVPTWGQTEQRHAPSLSRVLQDLAEVIRSRRRDMPEGAYTTYLFDKGIDKILKKVGEESAEVIIAAKNNAPAEIRYEVADLFYHLLVMLEERGVGLDEVAAELASRRK
ncbi:bifunctional phosphoribosyl-AMP cyclohydrolase/phosphoribosyl-ATP diphosphatase HisIE [Paradesulfitobacterium aromaticivorans]